MIMKNQKAIDYINRVYLDGCEKLTPEEIKTLVDNPSLENIEEIVGIDRFNEDRLETCKKIQKQFIS